MKQLAGALIEAWGEIKINRGRVVLSLIGVAAAVWAMATVMALGGILNAASKEIVSKYNGQEGTIPLTASKNSSSDSPDLLNDPYAWYAFNSGGDQNSEHIVTRDSDGTIHDPFAEAAATTAEVLDLNIYSKKLHLSMSLQAPGLEVCNNEDSYDSGSYDDYYNSACRYYNDGHDSGDLYGVDSDYFKIMSSTLLQGRLITDQDADLQMNPVVINEALWTAMGKPDVSLLPQISRRGIGTPIFTIVGVIKNSTPWDQAQIYAPYRELTSMLPSDMLDAIDDRTLLVLSPQGEEKKAEKVLESTLSSSLGPNWRVYSSYSGNTAGSEISSTTTTIIGAIGGIVILIGALGLLTVSIVTVRQRVREIGIRRAMGASAKRIFFAVFLESVVATTFAGLIGVVASVISMKHFNLVTLLSEGVLQQADYAYPLSSALLGIFISAGVGALCGIIPASIAVSIKPIDAIRF